MTQFASRAGEKLAFALEQFQIDVKVKTCADLGSNTGGFVDCLLQRGAAKIYAVDNGYGVLDWKLRNDPRVVVMERTNAMYVELPEKVDFISIDVGWTPQRLIVAHALELLKDDGTLISLIKPHYESRREWLEKGKVKPDYLPQIIEKVTQELAAQHISIKQIVESPIAGSKGGNIEYLALIRKEPT